MTRKDYVLLAAALRNAQPPCDFNKAFTPDYVAWFATVCSVAHALSRDNVRFDSVRFLAACGSPKGTTLPERYTRKVA